MKTFVRFVLIKILIINLMIPSLSIAESVHQGAAKTGSHISSGLDFSIVVRPRLQIRLTDARNESLSDGKLSNPGSGSIGVIVEGNSGSVSFHSTATDFKGTSTFAITMPAHRKMVRADSRRLGGGLRSLHAWQERNGGVIYTITQL